MIETVAEHEAGHVVMRWLRGLPATRVTVYEDGTGWTAGTGQRIDVWTDIDLVLAGPAAEMLWFIHDVDWEQTHFMDFDRARRLLVRLLGDGERAEAALRERVAVLAEVLWEHWDLLERLSERLIDERTLSARQVAALCREHGIRVRQNADDLPTP